MFLCQSHLNDFVNYITLNKSIFPKIWIESGQKYDHSKILEKNENSTGDISSKD